MIQKIRELLAMNEEVRVIKNNLKYTTNAVSELKEQIEGCKIALTDHDENFRVQTETLSRDLSKQLAGMQQVQNEFEKELYAFKLLKSQLQTKILERFEQELASEMKIQMEALRADAQIYSEMKNETLKMSGRMHTLSEEISKFTEISANIKKSDFELTNHARQLHQMDREKLELMRKIDTLERMVSKMRRQEMVAR